jgi:hypothetical protein
MFVMSGLLSATGGTRLRLALAATVVVYAGFALVQARRAKGGRRRAVVTVPVAEDEELAEPSFGDGGLEILGDADTDAFAEHAEDEDEDEPTKPATDAEFPPMPARLLEQMMKQAMAEELAREAAQNHSGEQPPTAEAAEATDGGAEVVVPEVVTHDLVPISSLHEARADAERQSLQWLRATVRGIGVRAGDDPAAVDVLARVVAAVDRLMVSDSSFARPALSETGPLLAAAAAAPQDAALPPQEATPLPTVPTMRPSDMPVTELSAPGLAATAIADQSPAPAPTTTTHSRPIDAVVVEDPELVLPIPAPPKPLPAPRGRRLRRNSVA